MRDEVVVRDPGRHKAFSVPVATMHMAVIFPVRSSVDMGYLVFEHRQYVQRGGESVT